jgi:hypothetical protein
MNHLGQTVAESVRKLCQAEQPPWFDTTTKDSRRHAAGWQTAPC